MADSMTSPMAVYIGSYNDKKRAGNDGSAKEYALRQEIAVRNPSFGVFSPPFFVTAIEADETENAIAAYRLAVAGDVLVAETGRVQLGGSGCCYLSVDPRRPNRILAASYDSGTIDAVEISASGQLSLLASFSFRDVSGVDAARQEAPHAHCIIPSLTDDRYLVADLGADRIYQVELKQNQFHLLHSYEMPAGSGPRHLLIHPTSHVLIALFELHSTIATYRIDEDNLTLLYGPESLVVANMDATVGDLELPQNAAHLALSLDGRFVYASNRGAANNIVVYEMDATGRLRYVGSRASGGINPKAFAVTEKFVVVANQSSNNVLVFPRDASTGLMEASIHHWTIATPVGVAIL